MLIDRVEKGELHDSVNFSIINLKFSVRYIKDHN
jgi:hypothetical protein